MRGYEPRGREFESLRACQLIERLQPTIEHPLSHSEQQIGGCVATDGSVILLVRDCMF